MAQRLSFEEAVLEILRIAGVDVLDDPSRFVAYIMDLCDESLPELRVAERNCDREFLSIFSTAVKSGSPEALNTASARGLSLLQNQRFIGHAVAVSVCEGIANALRQVLYPASNHSVIVNQNKDGMHESKTANDRQQNAQNLKPDTDQLQEIQQQQDTQTSDRSRKKARLMAICIPTGAIVVAIAIVSAVLFAGKRYSIQFMGNGAESGSVASVYVREGDTLELPANSYVKEGYTFAGWSLYGTLYREGDEYLPSGDTNFEASWDPEVHAVEFDGNGAQSGSADIVSVKDGESIIMPECTFVRNGYTFVNWVSNTGTYNPGDSVLILEDTTFKAIWTRDVGTSLVVDEVFKERTSDGDLFAAVFVRNITDENLWPNVEFTFIDAEGNAVNTSTDTSARFIAPGETFMLCGGSTIEGSAEGQRATDVSYVLSLEAVENDNEDPLSTRVSVQEVSREYDKLVFEVKNESSAVVSVGGVLVFARAKSDMATGFIARSLPVGLLAAGESKSMTIEDTQGWTLADVSYYLYGE